LCSFLHSRRLLPLYLSWNSYQRLCWWYCNNLLC
jgi:hypothetical protein